MLEKLYGSITITPDVAAEYNAQLPHWISVHSPSDKRRLSLLQLTLDTGEANAIALAMELDNALLIMDELKGRNVAKRLKLRYTGTLGILVEAKRRGHLPQLKPNWKK